MVEVVPFSTAEYRIISGTENGVIRISNPDTLDTEQTLNIRDKSTDEDDFLEVYHIVPFSQNRIVSIYRNDTLAVWNWLTGTLLFKLRCCEDSENITTCLPGMIIKNTITCITIFKQWIITGSEKGILKIWNFENGELGASVTHSLRINNVNVLPNNHIMIGLKDGYIAFFDIEKNIVSQIHNNYDELLISKNGKIITGCGTK